MKKLLLVLLCLGTIANAEVATKENIAKLYIATFDRAPDAAGLQYWLNSTLSLEEIALSFFEQEEAVEKYPEGTDDGKFVNDIFLNLFRRAVDPAGAHYWKNELSEGLISRELMILAIINGAKGNDAKVMENKLKVGLAFANDGLSDREDAMSVLDGITEDEDSVNDALCLYDLSGCSIPVSHGGDTLTPVITLNGDDNISLVVGEVDIELGATALDNKDGNITSDISIVNNIDTDTVGIYTITYTVSDAAGNTAEVNRTVNVIERWSRDNSLEVVTDHLDGRMWQDDEDAKTVEKNWQNAIDYCEDMDFATYTDWVLPTLEVLKSIVDEDRFFDTGAATYIPAIDESFQNILNDNTQNNYWSSTPWATADFAAWGVDFHGGGEALGPKSGISYVRCVRDII